MQRSLFIMSHRSFLGLEITGDLKKIHNPTLSWVAIVLWAEGMTPFEVLKLLVKSQSLPSLVGRNVSSCAKYTVLQMYCSSSLPLMSNDHLSPSSSTNPLCLGSLSAVKEERDTWLIWSQGAGLDESLLLSSIPIWTLIWEGVSGFMWPWACAS